MCWPYLLFYIKPYKSVVPDLIMELGANGCSRNILQAQLCLLVKLTINFVQCGAMLLVMGYATAATAAEAVPNISHEQLLQQERERWLQDQQQAGSDVRLQASGSDLAILDYPEQESPCFTIDSIGFSNTQAESQAYAFALQSVTQGAGNVLGRCLGSMGLRLVLMRVQQALVKQGYVTTRVLAGEQNLSGGHIVLTVVPGLVGAVRFSIGVLLKCRV